MPMSRNRDAYAELQRLLREVDTLRSIQATLGWDQETMMPPAGAPARAEQLALVAALGHERSTDERVGALLAECEADATLLADERVAANLREIRRDYDRARRLPTALVREFAETASLSMNAWKEARQRSDFAAFAPWLAKVVELNRRKAECYTDGGSGSALYDALLDEYEPGARAADVESIFTELRGALVPMIAEVAGAAAQPDDAPFRAAVPIPAQQELGRFVLERLGFDLMAGRLDTSTHPFCEGAAAGDTRLTTRYAETRFPDALSSTLHEAGHGMYEQGLPKREFPGQPLAQSASLSIHESQSRLWENMVGRSPEFWQWLMPVAHRVLGASTHRFSPDDLYRAVNRVERTLIRVDADETTYNLHIMLRFDLERALISGDLAIADLPAAWNDRVRSDLGLEVPDDARGCLQDIHWPMAAFGYFATYTLGTLYAAQLWDAIRRDLADLPDQIARGEFGALLGWLRENVHRHGRRYPAGELCRRATGAPLDAAPLIGYLRGKLAAVYGV
jgi:carboxypeptidase Taq